MLVKLTSRLLTHGLHLERGVNGEGADEARANDDDESALHLVNVWKNTKKANLFVKVKYFFPSLKMVKISTVSHL